MHSVQSVMKTAKLVNAFSLCHVVVARGLEGEVTKFCVSCVVAFTQSHCASKKTQTLMDMGYIRFSQQDYIAPLGFLYTVFCRCIYENLTLSIT